MVAGPDLMLQAAQSQTMAAWVQAYGSIAAILAAAGIAGWQSRSDSRLRKDTERVVARDLAMLIERPMRSWTHRAREWVRVLGLMDGMGEWAMISQVADSPELMEPPKEVERFVGRFRDFGSAAGKLQAASLAWNALSESIDEIRSIWNNGSEEGNPQAEGMQWAVGLVRAYGKAVLEAGEAVEALKRG